MKPTTLHSRKEDSTAFALNAAAMEILEQKMAVPPGEYVFWNPATGDRFCASSLKRAGLKGITLAYIPPHVRFTACCEGRRPDHGQGTLGATITVNMRYTHTNQEAKARAVATLGDCAKTVPIVPRRWKHALETVSQHFPIEGMGLKAEGEQRRMRRPF